MASRIAGITVEIGGDTTGLEKSLSSVNKTIRSTASELKDVERLLKLDPSNTELLTQKQKLLKESVQATKEKLDALKNAQEQAKQQLENGDLGQDKYDALQREIIATEQELEKLAKQAGETNTALLKIGDAGKTIENVGKKISGVGSSLSKNVTTPIMAIGAASMAAFSEVDSAMDTVITKTGATGDELERMQDIVSNIATSIPTDFQTAGNAVGEVATRFDDVGDDLEELSSKFIKFANINGIDVCSAIDDVQASMKAFGVPTKNAGLVLDTLNKIGQDTGVNVNQLSGMLTTNAGVMKEMGFSYEEAATFMGHLNKNGVDVGSTMTGLKKAWQTASKDGKSMSAVLGEMNNNIKNAKTDTEAYQIAIELFGSKAGPAIAEAVRSGRLSLDELGVSMADYAGNLETTFEATLDPIDQTTMMMNELKAVGSELASTIQEMLMPVFQKLREKLDELRERWSNLSEQQKQSIVRIAAIAAAVGPVLVVIGNLTSSVGKAMQAFSTLGKGISVIISQAQAGTGPLAAIKGAIGGISAPVIAVVAVIAVLAAAFKHLWDTNEEFRNKVTAIWESVKQRFEALAKKLGDLLGGIEINFSTITAAIGKVWDAFCNLLAPVIEAALKIVAAIVNTVLDSLIGILDIFKGIFTGDWSLVWQGVSEIFGGIWNGIKEILSSVLNMLKGLADTFLSWFGSTWDTAWNGIKNIFVKIWDGIKNVVSTVWTAIRNSVQTSTENIRSWLSTAWTNISTFLSTTMENILTGIKQRWENIKSDVSTTVEKLHTSLSSTWENIKSKASTTSDAVRNNVTTAWANLKAGVSNTGHSLHAELSSIWQNIRQSIISVITNLQSGVTAGWNSLKTSVTGIMNGLSSSLTSIWNGIKTSISGIVNGISSAMQSGFNGARNAVTSIFTGLSNSISSVFNSIRTTVSNVVSAVRGAFNFSWSLPHLKLPHISISGSFSLNPPSVPHFSISWYKKAMEDGMILNSPTIFGMQGNHLLAGGEAGSETVVGTQSLMEMIRNAVNSMASQTNFNYGGVTINLYAQPDQDIRELADEIEYRINNNVMRRRAAVGT